jgi:poly-gamma-glutamate capsule biosynthesis protein CapA/YwtB (metallophosphatase superfamily)
MADRRLNFNKGTKCEIEFYLRPRFYMKLAGSVNGAITRPVTADYLWGDALAELDRVGVDLHILNLETSITPL